MEILGRSKYGMVQITHQRVLIHLNTYYRVNEENKVHYASASSFDSIPELELVNFFTDLKFQVDGYDELMGKH